MELSTIPRFKVRGTIYAFMIMTVFLSMIGLIYLGMDGVKSLTWNGIRGGLVPDLFESIWHASCDNPYSEHAIYPPLVYLLLRFFTLFMSEPFPLQNQWQEMLDLTHSYDGIVLFVIYSLIIFIGSYLLIEKNYDGKRWEKLILWVFFIASSPFIYLYERGNTVIFSMFFLGIYFWGLNNINPKKRELAIICYAVSSCLKIYPVIAGVLMLKNRQWNLMIRTMLYGILLFFLPFFFTGGFDSFFDMIANIKYLSSETVVDTRDFGYGFKVNVSTVCNATLYLLGIENGSDIIISIAMFFFIGGLFFVIATTTENCYRVLAVCMTMVLLPPFSWIYNVVYLYIPFIFILNKHDYRWIDFCILILLFLAFVPLPYGNLIDEFNGINPLTFSSFVCVVSLYTLAILLILQNAFNFFINLYVKEMFYRE